MRRRAQSSSFSSIPYLVLPISKLSNNVHLYLTHSISDQRLICKVIVVRFALQSCLASFTARLFNWEPHFIRGAIRGSPLLRKSRLGNEPYFAGGGEHRARQSSPFIKRRSHTSTRSPTHSLTRRRAGNTQSASAGQILICNAQSSPLRRSHLTSLKRYLTLFMHLNLN